jgi:myo-inositol-1(or 4)-monophosphatase
MRFSKCLKASQGVRRLGSAAIDLCFIACGRFDGFWEQNLKPWDTAAGELIAREAGAIVTDFSNKPFTINKKEILATNGRIHKEMLSLLAIEDMV